MEREEGREGRNEGNRLIFVFTRKPLPLQHHPQSSFRAPQIILLPGPTPNSRFPAPPEFNPYRASTPFSNDAELPSYTRSNCQNLSSLSVHWPLANSDDAIFCKAFFLYFDMRWFTKCRSLRFQLRSSGFSLNLVCPRSPVKVENRKMNPLWHSMLTLLCQRMRILYRRYAD